MVSKSAPAVAVPTVAAAAVVVVEVQHLYQRKHQKKMIMAVQRILIMTMMTIDVVSFSLRVVSKYGPGQPLRLPLPRQQQLLLHLQARWRKMTLLIIPKANKAATSTTVAEVANPPLYLQSVQQPHHYLQIPPFSTMIIPSIYERKSHHQHHRHPHQQKQQLPFELHPVPKVEHLTNIKRC